MRSTESSYACMCVNVSGLVRFVTERALIAQLRRKVPISKIYALFTSQSLQ